MGWFDRRRSSGTPPLARLGETARREKYEVTVRSFEPWVPIGQHPLPEGHAAWVALVALANASSEEASYRSNQWRVYDRDGFVFEPHFGEPRREPRLIEGCLSPGTHVLGHVTFVLPIDRIPARIQFFVGYLTGHPVDFEIPPEANP